MALGHFYLIVSFSNPDISRILYQGFLPMLLFTKSCAWSKSAGRCIWNRNASYRTRLWNRNDSYRTRLDLRPSTVGVNRCEFKFEVVWCLVPAGKLFSYKKVRFRKSDVNCAQARFFARHDWRDFSKLHFVPFPLQKICTDFFTTEILILKIQNRDFLHFCSDLHSWYKKIK